MEIISTNMTGRPWLSVLGSIVVLSYPSYRVSGMWVVYWASSDRKSGEKIPLSKLMTW